MAKQIEGMTAKEAGIDKAMLLPPKYKCPTCGVGKMVTRINRTIGHPNYMFVYAACEEWFEETCKGSLPMTHEIAADIRAYQVILNKDKPKQENMFDKE